MNERPIAGAFALGTRGARSSPLPSRAYAAIAVGLALGSAVLVVAQVAFVHAYCTLCLHVCSWVLVVPAVRELVSRQRSPRAIIAGAAVVRRRRVER